MDKTTLKYGIKVGLAMAIVVLLTPLFHVQENYWVNLTVMAVMLPTVGATLASSRLRAVSTAAGVLVGGALAFICKDSFTLTLLFSFVFVLSGCYYLQNNTAYAIFSISALIVLALGHSAHHTWHFALWRFVDTVIGIGIAFIMGVLIFPSWSKILIKRKLIIALTHLEHLAGKILSQENRTHDIEATRAKLIEASNNLKNTFQEMQHETFQFDKRILMMDSIVFIIVRLRFDLYLMLDSCKSACDPSELKALHVFTQQIFNAIFNIINQKPPLNNPNIPTYTQNKNPFFTQSIRIYTADLSALLQNIIYYFQEEANT